MPNEEILAKKCWKAGQSGNPSGSRSKRVRLNELAKIHADAVDTDGPTDTKLAAAIKLAEAEGRDPKKDPHVKLLKLRTRAEKVFDELYGSIFTQHSVRAAEEYLSRVLGKPVTPLDVTTTVTHKTAEEHVAAIMESIGRVKANDDDKLPVN
jgi:hypothetical protein